MVEMELLLAQDGITAALLPKQLHYLTLFLEAQVLNMFFQAGQETVQAQA